MEDTIVVRVHDDFEVANISNYLQLRVIPAHFFRDLARTIITICRDNDLIGNIALREIYNRACFTITSDKACTAGKNIS